MQLLAQERVRVRESRHVREDSQLRSLLLRERAHEATVNRRALTMRGRDGEDEADVSVARLQLLSFRGPVQRGFNSLLRVRRLFGVEALDPLQARALSRRLREGRHAVGVRRRVNHQRDLEHDIVEDVRACVGGPAKGAHHRGQRQLESFGRVARGQPGVRLRKHS